MDNSRHRIEPPQISIIDMAVALAGAACVCALPSGLRWFAPVDMFLHPDSASVAGLLLWILCLVAVGVSASLIYRQIRYRCEPTVSHWLLYAISGLYLTHSLLKLQADQGGASLLLSHVESGVLTRLGSWGKIATIGAIFAVGGGYAVVLQRMGGLAATTRTLLGLGLLMLWYLGPADVWRHESVAALASVGWTGGGYASEIMLPATAELIVPLILLHRIYASWLLTGNFTRLSLLSGLLGGLIALLLPLQPILWSHRTTPTFFLELFEFAVLYNVCALVVAWASLVIPPPNSRP